MVIKALANLLRHRLRNTDIIGRYGGEGFSVSFSAGVAALNVYESGEQALEAADRALYQRKRAGVMALPWLKGGVL